MDIASYAGSALGVTVDLNLDGVAQGGAGDATGDKLDADIEGVAGSDKADILIADTKVNVLEGAGGSRHLGPWRQPHRHRPDRRRQRR